MKEEEQKKKNKENNNILNNEIELWNNIISICLKRGK
jgi:hypothetical protein